MEKIFVDSDIILDVLLKRSPFYHDAVRLLGLVEKGLVIGCTSALIIANCYYIICTNIDEKTARDAIGRLCLLLTVLPLTDKTIGNSLASEFPDFEDGLQYYIALKHDCKAIITRNQKDYVKAKINVFLPGEFLKIIEIKQKI